MAAQEYFLRFGAGNPALVSGLAPSFIIFRNYAGSNITPPSISEVGATSGLYKFTYDATQSIAFTADGATTGLASSDRYIVGALGVIDSVNNNVVANATLIGNLGISVIALNTNVTNLGSSVIALGSSLLGIAEQIGSTASSFGTSSADPTTVFGFLKRSLELYEGVQTYTKSTGSLIFASRGGSTTLRGFTITDTSTQTQRN